MSQCWTEVGRRRDDGKIQADAPNAGLGWRRAQSPYLSSRLSTKYPQATSHRHDHLSRSTALGNLEYRQVADESLSTANEIGLEISSPFSRFSCDPARQP